MHNNFYNQSRQDWINHWLIFSQTKANIVAFHHIPPGNGEYMKMKICPLPRFIFLGSKDSLDANMHQYQIGKVWLRLSKLTTLYQWTKG